MKTSTPVTSMSTATPCIQPGGVCSEPARIDAETVEQAAVSAFWALTSDLEAHGREDAAGDIAVLEEELERTEAALKQCTALEVQEALGELWPQAIRERRAARDKAAADLGAARAAAPATLPSVETLRGAWERMSVQERRELLSLRFHCLSLSRERSLVVYPAGSDVGDLPRRGFKRAPVLEPFPAPPDGARVLAL
jgi:hypothetical protein